MEAAVSPLPVPPVAAAKPHEVATVVAVRASLKPAPDLDEAAMVAAVRASLKPALGQDAVAAVVQALLWPGLAVQAEEAAARALH